MHSLLPNALATVTFLLLLAGVTAAALAGDRVPWLAREPRGTPEQSRPRVSIIAPALNEQRHLEAAVRSLLAQDYPELELVLIDDRSTDATPQILARLAATHPRLRCVTVRELPPGWLGKNHANWLGAQAASGELLLFTDADVVMAPDAVDRAVACLERGRWDHLAVAPRVVLPGAVLSQFTLYFGILFSLYARPWSARNPRSRAHVGIGAFNLVRRDAYFACGGHERIRMRPDDDIKLGKLLKHSGCRQDFLNGNGAITVEWYDSWREVHNGLMKNLFAGSGYSVAATIAGALAQLALLAGPVLALPFGGAAARALNLGSCALLLALGAICAPQLGTRRWGGVWLPAFALFGTWLMWRSMLRALLRGGIDWRGTRYSLAELRRNIV
jgi:Glycosyl transferase family 2